MQHTHFAKVNSVNLSCQYQNTRLTEAVLEVPEKYLDKTFLAKSLITVFEYNEKTLRYSTGLRNFYEPESPIAIAMSKPVKANQKSLVNLCNIVDKKGVNIENLHQYTKIKVLEAYRLQDFFNYQSPSSYNTKIPQSELEDLELFLRPDQADRGRYQTLSQRLEKLDVRNIK